jgi:hypothetical protein
VVRAFVCHLDAERIRYRVALVFDRQLDTSAGTPNPVPFLDRTEATNGT